jgi:hypothetical protein
MPAPLCAGATSPSVCTKKGGAGIPAYFVFLRRNRRTAEYPTAEYRRKTSHCGCLPSTFGPHDSSGYAPAQRQMNGKPERPLHSPPPGTAGSSSSRVAPEDEVDPAVLRRCESGVGTTIRFTRLHHRASPEIRVYEQGNSDTRRSGSLTPGGTGGLARSGSKMGSTGEAAPVARDVSDRAPDDGRSDTSRPTGLAPDRCGSNKRGTYRTAQVVAFRSIVHRKRRRKRQPVTAFEPEVFRRISRREASESPTMRETESRHRDFADAVPACPVILQKAINSKRRRAVKFSGHSAATSSNRGSARSRCPVSK